MALLDRRTFLSNASLLAAGFGGLRAAAAQGFLQPAHARMGYGKLVTDPQMIMDLPQGFSYSIISRWGDKMDDGLLVPGCHDGMAAFPGQDGQTILIRNHEIGIDSPTEYGPFGEKLEHLHTVDQSLFFDAGRKGKPVLGGTTTIVYDTQRRTVLKQFLSLAGTGRNCAGGPTPWGTWLTCEEWTQRANDNCVHDHGWVFEVPCTTEPKLHRSIPLTGLGRFNHEAVAIDSSSGCLYQTEDRNDGVIYRFVPNTPGKIEAGGRLQALAIKEASSADLRNWIDPTTQTTPYLQGTTLDTHWIDLEDIDSPEDDLRYRATQSGAAVFARGEGMWAGSDSIFFACTSGGVDRQGQIWQYRPSVHEGTPQESAQPGKLELFIESRDNGVMRNCDNLTVAPWGDLFVSEDSPLNDGIARIRPDGSVERFGLHRGGYDEICGVCFSPDGSTLFANVQQAGLTLAITGPWMDRRS
jgi:hypothetical protein